MEPGRPSLKIETLQRLHDAERACQEVQDFCRDANEASFLGNRGLMLIVHKLIEIIGEALKQAESFDPEIVDLIPDFRQIVNTRNRITHGYGTVNYRLLWSIVQTRIPSLHITLVTLLASEQSAETDE